jgi:serine/threonine protein phosphatase PrpC
MEAVQVSEVLGDGPDDLLAVDVGVVPLDELLGFFEVLCDGLFGEHVLAGGKCAADVVWLTEDGEAESKA